MSPFKTLLTSAAEYKVRITLGVLCIVAANILKAAGPLIIQCAIDTLTKDIGMAVLGGYSGLIVAIAASQGACLVGQEYAFFGLARCVEHDMRNTFYMQLQRLPLKFYHSNRIGDLMIRATSDITAAAAGTGHALVYSVNTIFAVVVIVPLMARLSWRLTAITFVPLMLVIAATVALKPRMRATSYRKQKHFGALSSCLEETLSAFRTILAFTQEESEIDKFSHVNSQYMLQSVRNIRVVWLLYPLLQFLIGSAYIGVLWYGGSLAATGKLSVGQFVGFSLYVGYLSWPMHELGTAINVFQQGMAAMTRVYAVICAQPLVYGPPDITSMPDLKGKIEFQNVTFTHMGATSPALEAVSCRISPDQIVALVGAVGSGKSTLMSMIPRMHDPDAGKVLIDGHPVQQLSLHQLRSFMGYAPQEPFLFNDSIAANIAFGKHAATPDEIEQAAIAAGIADDIAGFPRGFETIVGEKGILLSGGQRQRVGLARAIIRRPRVLLLDDALSAVDAGTEERILTYLRQSIKGRACLIASHRISAVKNADWIIVLDKGRVIEQGCHEELITRKGFYERIYRHQLIEDELITS